MYVCIFTDVLQDRRAIGDLRFCTYVRIKNRARGKYAYDDHDHVTHFL